MGSGFTPYSKPRLELWEKKATDRRVHLAPMVSQDILKRVDEWVINSPYYKNRERECYEMAAELRRDAPNIERLVQARIPGSALRRKNADHRGFTLAMRITMAVTDRICLELIRPGPTPADRQCSDMTKELWAMYPAIQALVAEVIQVEDEIEGIKCLAHQKEREP